MDRIFIGLVGDHDHAVAAHRAIPRALGLAGLSVGQQVGAVWVGTDAAAADPAASLNDLDGIWCVPASPYHSLDGALAAIRHARESGVPFLGTCGGFQHALVEFARSVCGIEGAAHAEIDPDAPDAVVTPLACELVETVGRVRFEEGSRIRAAYGAEWSDEGYRCRFGLNPAFRPALEAAGMRFTATDAAGEVRGAELPGHPFFVATLFQPERSALTSMRVPPLVRAFVQAALAARTATV